MTTITESKRCPSPLHEGPNPLPLSEFSPNANRKSGISSYCRVCSSARARAWYQANPDRAKDARRRWQQANPEKGLVRVHSHNDRLRQQTFDHYGRACACCGSTDRPTIDHIDGNGRQHRIEVRGRASAAGVHFYRWLVNNGFPSGFQTLCSPCNASKQNGPACRLDHDAKRAVAS